MGGPIRTDKSLPHVGIDYSLRSFLDVILELGMGIRRNTKVSTLKTMRREIEM